jgi:peptidyl-prolyl cis-trans isomerase D
MLQAINDRIKGWLGIAIVILIGLPFALWGIQSYFDEGGPRYAAKVNGAEITAREFERTVSMQRQAMLKQYGGKLPIEESVLRDSTLTQLINQRLLETASRSNGYRISDSILSSKIKSQFTVDGIFDRERFEMSVASIGMSIPMYEQSLRDELRVQQLKAAIINTSFATEQEVNSLASLQGQTRDIATAVFNVEHFSAGYSPTEDEIQVFYKANPQRFMTAEEVSVDYVEIKSESLSENVEIDEAMISKMYDDYVASAKGREERKARHILLKAGDDKVATAMKIDSIRSELEAGADFGELAKKYSQDTVSAAESGDLGWVGLGDMVKSFEKTLFSLDKGELSEIVTTKFGFHLIKLDDIRSEEVTPIGIKRYEFEEELKADSVASTFYDLSERLASLAYENPDNLDVIKDELELEIKTSGYLSRTNGKDIAAVEKVRNIAFSPLVLEQGSNSDIIEISPTHVVVLRTNEHKPEMAMPLATVKSKIENILKVQKGHERTKAAALAAKVKLESAESPESILELMKSEEGVSVSEIKALSRTESTRVSDPSILSSAFEMPVSQDDKSGAKIVDLVSGDVAIVILKKVNVAEAGTKEQLELVKRGIVSDKAISEFTGALELIKSNADIDKNTRILEDENN